MGGVLKVRTKVCIGEISVLKVGVLEGGARQHGVGENSFLHIGSIEAHSVSATGQQCQ